MMQPCSKSAEALQTLEMSADVPHGAPKFHVKGLCNPTRSRPMHLESGKSHKHMTVPSTAERRITLHDHKLAHLVSDTTHV